MRGMFRLTLLGFFFDTIVVAQFNFQQNDAFGFDCLDFHVTERQFRGVRFKFPIYEKIRYCRRPNDDFREISNRENPSSSFSFEKLRELNVTPAELLRWSSTVDQVEKYSIFLVDLRRFGSEMFSNCSSSWFGRRCEYSFDLGENLTFSNVVETMFEEKTSVKSSDRILTDLTCFQLLKCDRGASICLDWREICDGNIDCRNGGVDEENCWQLELNECEPNEYRCHNGICIPKDFLHDDRNNADCLDRTDEIYTYSQFDSCFQDPTFRCEEQTRHPSEETFSCGDGQYEKPLYTCKNGRDRLLEESILQRGNLAEKCSSISSCLTRINGTSCLNSVHLDDFRHCESIFEYPIHPVVSAHVRFFYFNNRTSIDFDNVFLPDFICYDSFLCETIRPSFIYKNLTCRRFSTMFEGTTSDYATLVQSVASFFQICSSTYKTFDVLPKTIYRCDRSSKFISNHRIFDNYSDCPLGDDETFQNPCGLNDSSRFRCNKKENKCFSPVVHRTICKYRPKDNFTQILFHEFCDGVSHLLSQQTDGFNHTDENDCELWPCSNIYTRCDEVKNCPNAEDEWNCVSSNCSAGFHPCFSPIDYKLNCLPFSIVQDGKIDCLGASDEFHLCQTTPVGVTQRHRYRYRCWNSSKTQCTAASNLCNGNNQNCPNRDDEKICSTPRNPCPKTPTGNRTTNDDLLCQLFDREVEKRMFFMLENVTGIRIKTENPIAASVSMEKQIRPLDKCWPWRCNRGLYVRYRNSTNDENFRCFCPPSYYGEFCQFQSERISLTFGMLVADQYRFYTIVVRLVDETSVTVASEQFPFMGIWGCYRSFNVYLLYPTRPKNLSKSYRLHIDAFDRNAMIYLSSWKISIPFLFLPINRIASQLKIPVRATSIVRSCSLKCLNGGQCRSYVNSPDVFCHCPSNWFGTHCENPMNCTDCSSDSLCIGSVGQRTLCLCPIDRAGPRCLIRVSCQPESCLNNGRCVLIDDQVINNNFICICHEPFYGTRCERSKTELTVSLKNDEFVSYVLAYVITTSNESQPLTDVMIKKTVPDQSAVTFYLKEPFHLVFIKISRHYYLATHSQIQCCFIDELINETEKSMPRIRLIKSYPLLCSRNIDLTCFFDGYYMCLCTSERHANCFEFNQDFDLSCHHNDYCENDGSCYQDHRVCPSGIICICKECYFGARCQYYAESLGVALDDILRYEFRRQVSFSQQNSAVILTTVITALMFGIGSISSIASFVTFKSKKVQQVGCGLYLLAASITSFLTVLIVFIKFWFLVGSQLDWIHSPTILRLGCTVVEPILKVLFYIDNWLKACVAIERSITVFRGISFNKSTSKRIAKWLMLIVPTLTIATMVHEPIYRNVIEDEEGQHRNWCVTNFSTGLRRYNSMIVVIHFLIPLLINIFSTIFIIVSVSRRRMSITHRHRYRTYLREQFNAHKHTLISPIILILLSLPRLIISLVSTCIKASHDPWLYLAAYFISFTPLVFMFIVFVLPSDLYHAEFKRYFHQKSDTS